MEEVVVRSQESHGVGYAEYSYKTDFGLTVTEKEKIEESITIGDISYNPYDKKIRGNLSYKYTENAIHKENGYPRRIAYREVS